LAKNACPGLSGDALQRGPRTPPARHASPVVCLHPSGSADTQPLLV